MEKLIKKKRMRTISVVLVGVIVLVVLMTDMKFESADYGKSMDKETDIVAVNEEKSIITVNITIENKTWNKHRSNIISSMKYECQKGDTVYEVLYAVCRNENIQMESQYTPAYKSYYVESIDGLYEFDGGSGSGWQYKVNDNIPDYGCSSYKLKGGEDIVWSYTCNFGKDI